MAKTFAPIFRIAAALLLTVLQAAPATAGLPELCSPFGDPICDTNGDGVASAADAVAAVVRRTTADCPGPATLELRILNRGTVDPVEVRLRGQRAGADCSPASLAESYERTVTCAAAVTEPCAVIVDLAPGAWVHTIEAGEGEGHQRQHRAALLVAGAGNALSYTLFASAFAVTRATSGGAGSLRSALAAAESAARPTLIWFDELAFPPGVMTTIPLDAPLPALAAGELTLDGTDSLGERGNRIIDANGRSFGALSITSSGNRIIGMRLRGAGANDRDVVNISSAGATANEIRNCILDNAGTADVLGVDQGAGSDFAATANRLVDSEIFGAADKGVKVTTGSHLEIEDSWIHGNANGGVQATLGGSVRVRNCLVEDNRGASAQNGLSVQAAESEENASYLESAGNIVRRNGANGLSVRAAIAVVNDSYFAVNGSSGIRIFNDVGPASEALVEGTAAVCNNVDGAVVANGSTADFGDGALHSAGENAFTQNNLPAGGANFRNATLAEVAVVSSQWEHCGRGPVCDEAAVLARDLSDGGRRTRIHPAQAHRSAAVPVIDRVEPSRGRAGEVMRIFGHGFNVIDGHFAEEQCADVRGRNRCLPLRGNCVKIGGVPAPVEAVTPSMLVVRRPFTCLSPVELTVTVDKGSTGSTSNEQIVCGGEGES